MVDAEYTASDHEFRENDDYARAKYDITLRWLGPARGRTLLNVGCGGGLFNTLAADAGFVVEACEPDPAAFKVAADNARTGITVHEGGLFDAPLNAGADVIVMHDVLEHIEDDNGAVKRLTELLDDDGRVVLSVPALQQLFGLHDEMLGHFRRYDKKTLRAVVAPRFTVERMRYFGLSFIPVTAFYSKWKRRPYPTGAAGNTSIVGKAFAAVCRAESRVPLPLGTSLVAELSHPRK
jgi:2-polyprenyl-3-methyl-5-hydroxy-6-metoxy-1,4-benzoquinol methylase